jgi:rhamnosyltransferase
MMNGIVGKGSTFAIVVTYEPQLERFRQVIDSLVEQVEAIAIVDNASVSATAISAFADIAKARFIPLSRNMGIASAQNLGIREALAESYDYVLLMDQDTILQADAVARLKRAASGLIGQGIKLGAVGSNYLDAQGVASPVWRANKLRIRKSNVAPDDFDVLEADFAIASGLLIPAKALRAVGLMEEMLFIDFVDFEWAFRALAKQYRIFQCRRAVMEHRLGEGWLKFGPRLIVVHTPVRNYFWVRNALILARRGYVKPAWRIHFVLRALLFLLIYPLAADQGGRRLRLIARGLWDGMRGRGGPLPVDLR